MKKNKKAFTLIEVIIASAILSITVFWVYKLIWENSKLINNSDNYLQLNSLFPAFEECIKNKWYSSFSGDLENSTKKINFWNNLNWCEIWNSNNVVIDNIEFFLETKIISKKNNYIDFELKIEWDWIAIEKKEFRLYK
jgi:prepilin-type N-terminal cleavage/methylation domain-containing protein